MRRAICSLLSIMVWVKLKPLASIALTAWSVTRLTSLANSWLLAVSAVSSPLDFSSRMRVISAERWLTAVEISSALPTKLRATSALTESSVRSTSPAFCLSTLLTPVDIPLSVRSASCALERIAAVVLVASWVSERSASRGVGLDRLAQLLDPAADDAGGGGREVADRALGLAGIGLDGVAQLLDARADQPRREAVVSCSIACAASPALVRIVPLRCSVRAAEQLGGGLAARLDLLGHGLGAPDQQLLEAADAGIEVLGDLHRAHAERLVDVVDLGADALGELGAAHVDDGGDVGDALVERADHLLAAFGHGLGDVHDAGGERLVERLGAAVERVAEAGELLVEAGGDLGRLGGDAGIEIVEVVAHRAGNVLRALAQPLDHLAAIGLHGAVELGEVAGDQIAERGRIAGDALGELGAAVIEHVLERLQPRRQHLAHRVAAVADHVGEHFGALAELVGDPVAALDDGVGDARAGLLELGDHVAAAQAEVEHQRIAGVLERGVHFLDAAGDGVGEPVAGLDHQLGHLLRAIAHHVEDRRATSARSPRSRGRAAPTSCAAGWR